MRCDVYDWVLIGGGIHGVTVATFLIRAAGIEKERLLLIDPAQRLLANWEHRAASVGMKTLRSSLVHHLDVDPFSLKKFADSREGRSYGKLRGEYGHPDNSLFEAHCRIVLEKTQLASRHLQARVTAVEHIKGDECIQVSVSGRNVLARNVVLAPGNPEPHWPLWSRDLLSQGTQVLHAFELGADETRFVGQNVAIIGGGLSAAQVALKASGAKAKKVKIFSRHALRKFQFDCDPGWIGPKYRRGFEKLSCPSKKRNSIIKARQRGSITPDVWRLLRRCIHNGSIELSVWGTSIASQDSLLPASPSLESGGGYHDDVVGNLNGFDLVILATGFEHSAPSDSLVSSIAYDFQLPLAPCGVPLLSSSVHWGRGVYVSGSLAEMRIGPFARNIPGARSAAMEIAHHVLAGESRTLFLPTTRFGKGFLDPVIAAH